MIKVEMPEIKNLEKTLEALNVAWTALLNIDSVCPSQQDYINEVHQKILSIMKGKTNENQKA